MANWLITVTFPGLRDYLGLAYGFYALCAVLSGLFVWKWVMETKGVSLEDMHAEAHVTREAEGRLAVTRARATAHSQRRACTR